MKRLNNKGTTIIEIILCFALASLIIISLYNIIDTISTNKRNAEVKFEISNQKSILTKTILSDIGQYGLNSITINGSKKDIEKNIADTPMELYGPNMGTDFNTKCRTFDASTWQCKSSQYKDVREQENMFSSAATSVLVVTFSFKDGKQKELRILKQVNDYNLEKSDNSGNYVSYTATHGDKFYIAYGEATSIVDIHNMGKNPSSLNASTLEKIDFNAFGYDKKGKDRIYRTGIGNISVRKKNQFLALDIRFNDVNLKQKYGIFLASPTTIDQSYIEELTDMPGDSEEINTYEDEDEVLFDTLNRIPVDELTTITLADFENTSDANYWMWKSYRTNLDDEAEEEPEELPGESTIGEDIYASNGVIVAIVFPGYTTDGTKFKNTLGRNIGSAIKIVNSAGNVISYSGKSYNFTWNNNTFVDGNTFNNNLRHPLALDIYEEKDVTDAQGNITGTEYVFKEAKRPTDNIYFTDHNFKIMIHKDLRNIWTEDEFRIELYEHVITAPPPSDDNEDELGEDEDDY